MPSPAPRGGRRRAHRRRCARAAPPSPRNRARPAGCPGRRAAGWPPPAAAPARRHGPRRPRARPRPRGGAPARPGLRHGHSRSSRPRPRAARSPGRCRRRRRRAGRRRASGPPRPHIADRARRRPRPAACRRGCVRRRPGRARRGRRRRPPSPPARRDGKGRKTGRKTWGGGAPSAGLRRWAAKRILQQRGQTWDNGSHKPRAPPLLLSRRSLQGPQSGL